MSILKKLSAGDGSVFKEIEEDVTAETMSGLLPLAQKFIEPILDDIKKELGDDDNIGVIRNIDGQLVITLLKGSETDLEIKNAETIIKTFDISELADMIKNIV